MKVPNHKQAQVAEAKIVKYLLNDDHPRGKDKAAFFTRFGFSLANWRILEYALLQHATEHDAVDTLLTEEGTHYTVEGTLTTPDGRDPLLRTVWTIDKGADNPRFITAYPLKPRKDNPDDT